MLDLEFMRLALRDGRRSSACSRRPSASSSSSGRHSLIGDGIGHVAFAGVAVGYLLGISPVLTALVAAVVGALDDRVAAHARRRTPATRRSRSSSTRASPPASSSSRAAGALNVNLFPFLFGSILTVTRGDLWRVRRARRRRARDDRRALPRRWSRRCSTRRAAASPAFPSRALNVVVAVLAA